METIQKEQEKLAALQKKTRTIYVVHMLAYVVVLVLLAVKVRELALVLGFGNVLLYVFYVRRMNKAYSDAITKVNLQYGLCASLTDVQHTGRKNGMTDADMHALQMLPLHNNPTNSSLMCHNVLHAVTNGLPVRCLEATLHYSYKNPGKERPLYRFVNGTMLSAEGLPASDARGDWLLLRKDLILDSVRKEFVESCGYRMLDLATGLGETYFVYTHSDAAVLPDHLRNHLTMLDKAAPTVGAVRLTDSKAYVFLSDRFYTARTPLYELPTTEQLTANPLPERDAVLAFLRYWAQAN